MTNDKPTSLRMGFGYGQARAAGLGGVRASRSPRQVNQILKENKSARDATESLREYAKDVDPNLDKEATTNGPETKNEGQDIREER